MQRSIQWHRVDQVIVVRAQGDDLQREDCSDLLRRVVADNPGCDMVLSCEGVHYISSSSLAAIIAARSALQRAGRRMVLVSLQPSLLEALQMVNIDRLFTVVPDEETALSLLAGAKARPAVPVEKGTGP